MAKVFCIIMVFLSTIQLVAQDDYTWWNQKHNYDGVTHWRDYLILSAAYMGPNALSVPQLRKAELDSLISLENSLVYHHSKGERTVNFSSWLHIPLYSDRVALQAEIVPIEYFEMDTITRDVRRSRNRSGNGLAAGDLYLRTMIQLVKNQRNIPDLLLTIQLKTASGTNLSSARYTDTPGYAFDLSFGKSIHRSKGVWRIYGQGGFYVYQLFGDGNQQNDAFLYGGGIYWRNLKWQLENNVGGYYGYFNNGDRPVVNRFQVRKFLPKQWEVACQLQIGLHDFNYNSIALSVKKSFNFQLK